ncbi:MAG: NAD(+) kinase [Buchnera aphidicola (Chaetogeoica yunlongensis)]
MKQYFNFIGIIGCPRHRQALNTHKFLYSWLINQGYNVIFEHEVASKLKLKDINIDSLDNIGIKCDLAIVVGGDGNMLRASRVLSYYDIKIIGINRGTLGFLTDLNPDTALQQLFQVLSGKYFVEQRFLLELKVIKDDGSYLINQAINEVVLHSGNVAYMIDFEVYINNEFSFAQRADGLIIATPTGSTGYSLSAGGPILVSSLEAMVLVPMFPHTLSSRPLVIDSSSVIFFKVVSNLDFEFKISCDSQTVVSVSENDNIFISKSKNFLHLLHPKNYNYFDTLNSKLNWSKKCM